MVVGDPKQLEPVVVVPYVAQQRLRSRYGVDKRWLPSVSSVQVLADQLNRFGTTLDGDDDEPQWVGALLRVHRRCIAPMFAISNRIDYRSLMIQATVESPDVNLPASCWYDIGGPVEDHWRPDQGAKADQIVTALLGQFQLAPDDVFLLSPFRQVANELEKIGFAVQQRMRGPRAQQVGKVRAGTVHKAQGRQASVVVLVLGGDPRKPGSKAFASEKANLLNVAVSRAQPRLYVIGDYDDWSGEPYFNELARALKRKKPPPRTA